MLSEEILDEVDATLGFPKEDPHGSPIPAKIGFPETSLSSLKAHQIGVIAQEQVSEIISTQLWKLGLLPDSQFKVDRRNSELMFIQHQGREIAIPVSLAQRVNVEVLVEMG